MAKDQKYLRWHGGKWWLHYPIPIEYKLLPQCINYDRILPKNLETDSLSEAKRRRDIFLHSLAVQAADYYNAWLPHKEVHNESAISISRQSLHIVPRPEHPNVVKAKQILMKGSALLGDNPSHKKLKEVASRERDAVYALTETKRHQGESLKELTKLVVKESRTQGKATKTIYKIERGTTWFLSSILQNDISISAIEHDQVREFVLAELDRGVAGSTLKGHLYGLRQIWKRAKQSKLVSGDCPFVEHTIKTDSKPFDPFTYEEIYELYKHADSEEFKTLIHAAATTGARADELLAAEVKLLSTFDRPCWLFNFKRKGKTPQSTRAVPVHSSLDLPDGFKFKLKYKTVQNKMKRLVEEVLGKPVDEFSGLPRKLSLHSLRTTVITELVTTHNVNEKVVGRISGHRGGGPSSVGSLRTYIRPKELDKLLKLVELLPWDVSSCSPSIITESTTHPNQRASQ